MSYFADLGLTLAVEVPIVVAVAGRAAVRWSQALGAAALANVLTHPLLWFAVAPGFHQRWGLTGIGLAELGVVAVEGVVYSRGFGRRFGAALALWLAVLANAASFGAGLAVHHGLS
ncbi:MAG: hypothetical protein WCC60_22490 [Ilumatobacteraceae bacterium]